SPRAKCVTTRRSDADERELATLAVFARELDRDRVVPREARVAIAGRVLPSVHRAVEPRHREIPEAVGRDVARDLVGGVSARDELLAVRGVDAVEAGPRGRRRADPQ